MAVVEISKDCIRMPDAVIFDFDGVIVDSEPLHWLAFQRVLAPLGFSFSWEEYLASYVGLDDRGAFRSAFAAVGRLLPDDDLAELISRKASVFGEETSRGVAPYPGVAELVAEAARNRPIALCSGALRSDILPVLESLDLLRFFPVLVSAEDVRVSKPHPESYRLALQRLASFSGLSLRAASCLAIEDTPAGIESALGAGLPVLGVTNNFPARQLGRATRVVTTLEGMTLAGLGAVVTQSAGREDGR